MPLPALSQPSLHLLSHGLCKLSHVLNINYNGLYKHSKSFCKHSQGLYKNADAHYDHSLEAVTINIEDVRLVVESMRQEVLAVGVLVNAPEFL